MQDSCIMWLKWEHSTSFEFFPSQPTAQFSSVNQHACEQKFSEEILFTVQYSILEYHVNQKDITVLLFLYTVRRFLYFHLGPFQNILNLWKPLLLFIFYSIMKSNEEGM